MGTPIDSTHPESRPLARRSLAWTEAVAWGLILLTVLASIAKSTLMKPGEATEGGAQLMLTARYAVGVNQWMGGLHAAGGRSAGDQLVESMERSVKGPSDRLRMAIVEGEITGEEKAVARIVQLRRTYAELHEDADTLLGIYGRDPEPGEGARQRFQERYGWFAQLARSHGKPPGDPDRAAALGAATRTLLGLVGIIGLFGAGNVVGLVLLIVGIVLLVRGRLPRLFRTAAASGKPEDRRVYVEAFAVYIVGVAFLGLLLRHLLNLPLGWAALSLPVAFVGGALWPLARGQRWAQVREVAGLHANGRGAIGVVREVMLGLAGYLAGLPLIALGMAMTIVLVKLSGADTSHPLTEALGRNHIGFLLALLLASVWAPFTEEMMFRGMLYANLRERFGWWIAAPMVAFIFAIIHPQGWAAVPVLGAIALVFAAIREWRGSVLGAVAAHAVHNGVTVVWMFILFS